MTDPDFTMTVILLAMWKENPVLRGRTNQLDFCIIIHDKYMDAYKGIYMIKARGGIYKFKTLNHGATWFILVLKLIISALCKERSSIGDSKILVSTI